VLLYYKFNLFAIESFPPNPTPTEPLLEGTVWSVDVKLSNLLVVELPFNSPPVAEKEEAKTKE